MTRVKSPAARKHREILKRAKGFKNSRSRRLKVAKEAVLHAGHYAYVGRKQKKRNLRSLWILRMNAALRESGTTYSKFIAALKKEKVELDRKVLAEIAVKYPEDFKTLVGQIIK